VSNFQVNDMEDLFLVPDGHRCATTRCFTISAAAAFERDLLPWCVERALPVMAYSPLGGSRLVQDATLARIGAAHNCAATAVGLAWVIRGGNVIAIPESGSPAHVKENAVALSLSLTPQELHALDAAFPV
jgi:diketogulonate reductase-like aldo/keto reductase